MKEENNKNQKRNTNNKAQIYTKSFKTFEDGISEIIKHNHDMKYYLGESTLYESVVHSLLSSIQNDIPSMDNPNYPNTLSIKIDAKGGRFKSDMDIIISWNIVFDYKSGDKDYEFTIIYDKIPAFKRESLLKGLSTDGWELKQYNPSNNKKKQQPPKKDDVEEIFEPNKPTGLEPATVLMVEPISEDKDIQEYPEPVEEEKIEHVEVEEVSNDYLFSRAMETDSTEVQEFMTEEMSFESEEAEDAEVLEEYPDDYPMTRQDAIKHFLKSGNVVGSFSWEDPQTGKTEIIGSEEIDEYRLLYDNHINKGPLDNKFLITYHGQTFILDIDNPSAAIFRDHFTIDQSSGIISFPDIDFDYHNLKVQYKD